MTMLRDLVSLMRGVKGHVRGVRGGQRENSHVMEVE